MTFYKIILQYLLQREILWGDIMKMLEKIKQKIYEIMTEEDEYEDEEPLTEEDEKLKMFIENPIGTIARIIGLGFLEDDDNLGYGNDDLVELSDPSNFDSDYITKQELINRNNNNSKIIKYDFKNKREL